MSSDPPNPPSQLSPRPPPEPSSGSPRPSTAHGVDEVSELRARVEHLEQTLQEMRQRHLADLKALRQSQHLLSAILDNTTAMVFARDTVGRFVLVNRRYEEFYKRSRSEFLGRTSADWLPTELAERLAAEDQAVLAAGVPSEYEDEVCDANGVPHSFLTIKFPLKDATGAITGLCAIATDITERKRAAEDRAALQQQIIDTQRAALRELSTPLIPLHDGVLAVPLIGAIDSERAAQIVEVLLQGVMHQRAHTVILDITGVRVVDSTVARGLMQVARATRLLGAKTILTGLRAEVAQALVNVGADLGDLVTLGTLQAGIAHALRSPGTLAKNRP